MRYLSVCAGIEAASVAWHPLGWRAAAFSEIEPFPRAVLRHHWPDIPIHGRDRAKGETFEDHAAEAGFQTIGADDYGAIDLLVGGTPCQSFSIAGKRGGLADDRGNLALEYIRLADRKRPRWVVWENVPGVFSSNGGEDFRCFLSGLVRWSVPIPEGGWSSSGVIAAGPVDGAFGVAWRILDAQFFGVAQRRRRVFVVGYIGDWRRAAAVLLERNGLSGNPAPRREKGQGLAKRLARGASQRLDSETDTFIGGWDYENNAHGPDEPTGPLLKGSPTGGGRPLPAVAYAVQGGGKTSQRSQGSGWKEGCSSPLNCMDEHAIAFGWQNSPSQGLSDSEHHTPTLDKSKTPVVAFAENQRGERYTSDVTNSLAQQGGKPGQGYPAALVGSSVRRLTPRECERLQGFPDDYTLIPYRGKPAADGPRYKALGNSMAVPVMRWIGRRIQAVEDLRLNDCQPYSDAAA